VKESVAGKKSLDVSRGQRCCVSDLDMASANFPVPASGNLVGSLPVAVEVILEIEKEAEERFWEAATALVTDNRWAEIQRRRSRPRPFDTDVRQQKKELFLIVAEFAGRYKKLLENAVAEFCREIDKARRGAGVPNSSRASDVGWRCAYQFVNRFTMGEYESPWDGFFILRPPAQMAPTLRDDDELDAEVVTVDFQDANALAKLFEDAEVAECRVLVSMSEELTGSRFEEVSRMARDHVRCEYATHLGGWESSSVYRAKNQFAVATTRQTKPEKSQLTDCERGPSEPAAAEPKVQPQQLTPRELKVWGVIKRGVKGLEYCRELANARIAPLQSGTWKGCPRKYESAYMEGKPWRHRIQDEKSKIRRKAKLAGLAKLVGE
jgi:hypothetical protein